MMWQELQRVADILRDGGWKNKEDYFGCGWIYVKDNMTLALFEQTDRIAIVIGLSISSNRDIDEIERHEYIFSNDKEFNYNLFSRLGSCASYLDCKTVLYDHEITSAMSML